MDVCGSKTVDVHDLRSHVYYFFVCETYGGLTKLCWLFLLFEGNSIRGEWCGF